MTFQYLWSVKYSPAGYCSWYYSKVTFWPSASHRYDIMEVVDGLAPTSCLCQAINNIHYVISKHNQPHDDQDYLISSRSASGTRSGFGVDELFITLGWGGWGWGEGGGGGGGVGVVLKFLLVSHYWHYRFCQNSGQIHWIMFWIIFD